MERPTPKPKYYEQQPFDPDTDSLALPKTRRPAIVTDSQPEPVSAELAQQLADEAAASRIPTPYAEVVRHRDPKREKREKLASLAIGEFHALKEDLALSARRIVGRAALAMSAGLDATVGRFTKGPAGQHAAGGPGRHRARPASGLQTA